MVPQDHQFIVKPSHHISVSREYSQQHVLVVEQSKRIAKYVRRILETHLGCHVIQAANGNEALAKLDSRPVDALICEMMLGGAHGLALVREIHAAYPEMGIIVMGERTARFPFVEAIGAGATDYIQKPFLPAEVEAKVIRIFKEQALRLECKVEARKYRSLFELSIDGMVLLDSRGAVIEDINPAFQELCFAKKNDLIGKPIPSLIAEQDRQRFEQWLSLCTLIGRGAIADLKLNHPDNPSLYVDISITVVQSNKQVGIFLAFKDVSEKREVQLRLAEAAQRDSLTGLFNRRAFAHHIHNAVRTAHDRQLPLTLFVIDLDGFKICNDTHGHPVGDQILIEAASVISLSTRSSSGDAGFRYGGDEFAVIMSGVGLEEGQQIARRIQHEFCRRDTKGVTMSIGLAQYLDHYSVEDFIRAADQAMYDAKESGKNTVRVAQP